MKCPTCALELIVVERSGIEIDYCIHCRGFWFDEGEIGLLAEALQLPEALPDFRLLPCVDVQEKRKRCPRCSKALDKIRSGRAAEIVVDRCPQGHGLWFDAGEVGRMLARHRRDGQDALIEFLGETIAP